MICVSTADWDAPLWTNKQHLMRRLADRGAKVLYLDSLGLRAPAASSRDAGRMVRRVRAWRPLAGPVESGVLRDSPLVVPFHGNRLARTLNHRLLRARLHRNELRWRLQHSVMWAYAPTAVHMFDGRRHQALVYHCVDDLAAFPGIDSESFLKDELALINLADVCIASSRPLLERLRSHGADPVLYWPNPADVEAYAGSAREVEQRTQRRIIGFIGAVQEHKLDVELIAECADRRPDWEWRLIGPVGEGLGASAIHRSAFPENVRLLGAMPREDLPRAVAEFDVATIPYRLNRYTDHVFPMKVFEYLAAGLPVISTPLPSLLGEVEHVAFAQGADEFVAALAASMSESDRSQARDRVAYARGFSWERRADEALALLKDLGQPQCSGAHAGRAR